MVALGKLTDTRYGLMLFWVAPLVTAGIGRLILSRLRRALAARRGR